jgi:hypothetical protein
MQIVNSRTFDVSATEQVTFSVIKSAQVSGATGAGGTASGPLPLTVTGPQRVTIAAGSEGGTAVDRIDQVPNVGFRTRTYSLI